MGRIMLVRKIKEEDTTQRKNIFLSKMPSARKGMFFSY